MSNWKTSVDELIALFGDALRALVPVAERAQMSWKEPDAYDDWDHICQAIYRSIVIGSLEQAADVSNFLPMLDYDRRTNTYQMNSFIGDTDASGGAAFVCFETKHLPFDRCLFVVLDRNFDVVGERRTVTAATRFSFFYREPGARDQKSLSRLTVRL